MAVSKMERLQPKQARDLPGITQWAQGSAGLGVRVIWVLHPSTLWSLVTLLFGLLNSLLCLLALFGYNLFPSKSKSDEHKELT